MADITNCYTTAAGTFAIAMRDRRAESAHSVVSSFAISDWKANNNGPFWHRISRYLENLKSRFGRMLSRSIKTGLFENVETEMSETIHVERVGRTPTTAIELCHSPDDGGYYLSNTDFLNRRNRTSEEVYSTRERALADWHAGTVKWEPWY